MSDSPPGGTLRLSQAEAERAISHELGRNVKRLYVEMPTSTGKTRLMLDVLDRMRDPATGLPPHGYIVEPTVELVRNNAREVARWMPWWLGQSGGTAPVLDTYYGEHKRFGRQLTAITATSFVRAVESGLIDPRQKPVIVLDEAHGMLSDRRRAVIDRFAGSLVIGASATPRYSVDKNLDESFVRAYHLDAETALRRREMAPTRNVLIRSDLTRIDEIPLTAAGQFDPEALRKLADQPRRTQAALAFYRKWTDPETARPLLGRQGIVFCTDIRHAVSTVDVLNEGLRDVAPAGVTPCAVVHGNQADAVRDRILERFRDGKIWLLTTADYLVAGYDNPNVVAAINLAPSLSGVVVGQRGGRPGRYNPGDPDKVAVVADIVDACDDPQKLPLLYSEVVQGTVRQRTQDVSPTPRRPPTDMPEGFTLIDAAHSVEAFMRERHQFRQAAARLPVDRVLPPIRAAMTRQGLQHVSDLTRRIGKLGYQHNQVVRMVYGLDIPWKSYDYEPKPIARDICIALKRNMLDLFDEPEAYSRGERRFRHGNYSPETAENTRMWMQQAGFSTVEQVRDVVQAAGHKISKTFLYGLLNGVFNPVGKDGDFRSSAHELATVLNTSPELLFGYDPVFQGSVMSKAARPAEVDGAQNDRFLQRAGLEPALRLARRMERFASGERLTVADMIAPPADFDNPELAAHNSKMAEALSSALGRLSPRTETVLVRRSQGESLEEIGDTFKVGRERVRQIESKGLRQLRHPAFGLAKLVR